MGYAFIECETKLNLSIILKQIKHLNPNLFVMEFSNSEIASVEEVFPNSLIRICFFHAKQAWKRWLTKSKYFII